MTKENGVEAPDQREQFAQVLKMHRVKPDAAESIAAYIADSSEGAVFEIPQELADKVGCWALTGDFGERKGEPSEYLLNGKELKERKLTNVARPRSEGSGRGSFQARQNSLPRLLREGGSSRRQCPAAIAGQPAN